MVSMDGDDWNISAANGLSWILVHLLTDFILDGLSSALGYSK